MREDYIKLVKNFFSLVVVQGGHYILPLITFPYLVSTLGIENYGKIAYALAFIQYFIIFTGFGFNLSSPKEIAENTNNQDEINKIFSSIIASKLLLLLLSIIVFVVLLQYVPVLQENRILIMWMFLIVVAQTFMPSWYFQGTEDMKWITVISLTSKLVYAISIFVFIKDQSDYVNVAILNGISQLIAAFIGVFIAFKYTALTFVRPRSVDIIGQYRKSMPFFLSRVSVSLYTASNTFFLGSFGSMEMVGNFSIAEKLYTAIQGVYHPLVNALYPFIVRLKDVSIFKKIIKVVSFTNVFFIGSVYIFAPYLFNMLFETFNPISLDIFQLMTFICIIILPSILLGYPFLAAMGHPKFTNLSVIIASGIHMSILLIYAAIGELSEMKIIYALFITEFTVLTLRMYGVRKYKLW